MLYNSGVSSTRPLSPAFLLTRHKEIHLYVAMLPRCQLSSQRSYWDQKGILPIGSAMKVAGEDLVSHFSADHFICTLPIGRARYSASGYFRDLRLAL